MNQKELVFFLGGKENVSIQLDDSEDFQTVLHRLEEKLEAGAILVAGNKLKLDIGKRNLAGTQIDALKNIFTSRGLSDPFESSIPAHPVEEQIKSSPDPNPSGLCAPSPEMHLSSPEQTQENTSLPVRVRTQTGENNGHLPQKTQEGNLHTPNPSQEGNSPLLGGDKGVGEGFEKPAAAAQTQEEKKIPPEEKTLLVKKTLRSGQSVDYDGNIVILGDVNPGAEVNAGGDILIMGALRGTVHAGCNGDKKSIIAALKVMPVQARIASITAAIPAAISQELLPQVLSAQNDKIKLEKLK